MRRFSLLLFSVFLFWSCAGRPEVISDPVSQESVTYSSFEGSVLYESFLSSREEGPLIPGLKQPLVPQGMAYWEQEDLMLISNYMSDETAGVLSIVSMSSGELEKFFYLHNSDGTPHLGHLGGLAISDRYLWISSGKGIYSIELQVIFNSLSGQKIVLPELIETETKGSFATFSDGILWIGEFTRKNGDYPVPRSHHRKLDHQGIDHRAWLGGYRLNDKESLSLSERTDEGKLVPSYILSIPDEIQGAVIRGDRIALSASFGRKNYSRLHLYSNPLNNDPDEILELARGIKSSLWILGAEDELNMMVVPPMSEALVLYENDLAVLFESGAVKYRYTGLYPLDRIQFIAFIDSEGK